MICLIFNFNKIISYTFAEKHLKQKKDSSIKMREIDSVTVYVELPNGNRIESFNIDAQFTAKDITKVLEDEYNDEELAKYEQRKEDLRGTRSIVQPAELVDLTLTAHSVNTSVTFRPTDKILTKLNQSFGRERTIPLLVVEYKKRTNQNTGTRVPSPTPPPYHGHGGKYGGHGGIVSL